MRSFVLRGETIFDENAKIAKDGWVDNLVALVKELRLDIDDGHGLHFFVYRMQDDGLLPNAQVNQPQQAANERGET